MVRFHVACIVRVFQGQCPSDEWETLMSDTMMKRRGWLVAAA
ncbi:MAG: hypothetical protein RLZZ395_2164, partial [Pseudomonadota bacterium]